MKTWLPSLEKKIEEYSEGAHASYRIFLSAEPAPNPGKNYFQLYFVFAVLAAASVVVLGVVVVSARYVCCFCWW